MPSGVFNIKKNVPDEYKVELNGTAYYPISYNISFDNQGKPQHIAILHDLKANSIVECDLNKLKTLKEN